MLGKLDMELFCDIKLYILLFQEENSRDEAGMDQTNTIGLRKNTLFN